MSRKRLFGVGLAAILLASPALAQNTRVVASCASPGVTWTAADLGRPLFLDTSGLLCTNSSSGGGGAVTQGTSPWVVSNGGTFAVQATQAGTWTVTGAGGTFPITAAALPLPSGAATSALQSTMNTTLGSPFQAGGSIGNTAFASTQSGTWNITNVSGTVSLPTGAATSANQTTMATNQTVVQAPVAPGAATATKAGLAGGQYNSAIQAFTNGQQGALQFDQRGGVLLQDGQVVAPASVTSATTLFTVAETSGYSSISVQVTSAGVATVSYEVSDDGTTWTSVSAQQPNVPTNATAFVSSSTAVGLLHFALTSKQFRARVSSYTSGTVTAQATLRKDALPRNATYVLGLHGDALAAGANGLPTVYEGRTTNKTAVATGQYVRPIATSVGAVVNKPFQVPELDWSYVAASGGISNTTTAVTIIAAAGSGIRNYLTSIQLSAPTLGAATEVAVRDGAAGTVIWRGFMSTAGGNQSVTLASPIKSTANTLLEVVTLTATVTGAVYVNAQGYQAP